MKTVEYKLEVVPKGESFPLTMTYGYSKTFRKWSFKPSKGPMLLIPCHGKEEGHKIANIIRGAFLRSGSIDNMARSNITKLIQ